MQKLHKSHYWTANTSQSDNPLHLNTAWGSNETKLQLYQISMQKVTCAADDQFSLFIGAPSVFLW